MNIISTGLLSVERSSRLPEYITFVNYSAMVVKDTLKYCWEAGTFLPGFSDTGFSFSLVRYTYLQRDCAYIKQGDMEIYKLLVN